MSTVASSMMSLETLDIQNYWYLKRNFSPNKSSVLFKHRVWEEHTGLSTSHCTESSDNFSTHNTPASILPGLALRVEHDGPLLIRHGVVLKPRRQGTLTTHPFVLISLEMT